MSALSLQIERLLLKSTFVFQGLSADAPKLRGSAHTTDEPSQTVRIQRVFKPLSFATYVGQIVIIKLRKQLSIPANSEAVFFTVPTSYAENVIVDPVSVMPLRKKESLPDLIVDSLARLEVRAIKERIARSSLVVAGKVLDIKRMEHGEADIGYDAPDWHEAKVEIISVLKGKKPTHPLTVTFPNSDDRLWYSCPRFRPGQERVWLLRTTDIDDGKRTVFTALHREDVHPISAVDMFKRLTDELQRKKRRS